MFLSKFKKKKKVPRGNHRAKICATFITLKQMRIRNSKTLKFILAGSRKQ